MSVKVQLGCESTSGARFFGTLSGRFSYRLQVQALSVTGGCGTGGGEGAGEQEVLMD